MDINTIDRIVYSDNAISDEPLFDQGILLGGSFLMMRPATEETAERLYKTVSKDMGLSDKSAAERVRKLDALPAESMLANLTPELASLGPVVDGETVPTSATFAILGDAARFPLPGHIWCRRALVTDSQADVSSPFQVADSQRFPKQS
jgi:hypothetical protein